jgi:hypothetical protein
VLYVENGGARKKEKKNRLDPSIFYSLNIFSFFPYFPDSFFTFFAYLRVL